MITEECRALDPGGKGGSPSAGGVRPSGFVSRQRGQTFGLRFPLPAKGVRPSIFVSSVRGRGQTFDLRQGRIFFSRGRVTRGRGQTFGSLVERVRPSSFARGQTFDFRSADGVDLLAQGSDLRSSFPAVRPGVRPSIFVSRRPPKGSDLRSSAGGPSCRMRVRPPIPGTGHRRFPRRSCPDCLITSELPLLAKVSVPSHIGA